MTEQPHILLIVLDTQRRDRLSLYGHDVATSSHLDDFAQEATIFERAIAPAQWTIPAHASIFTGLYPAAHQLTQAFQELSGMHPTLAEILRVDGYHTVAFCNNPLLGLLNHDLQRGFSEFYNYAGASPNRPTEKERSALYRQLARTFRRVAQRATNAFALDDRLFGAALNPLIVPIWSRLVNFKGNTARSVSDLIDYWRAYHAGGAQQPIFAFLNLMGTHTPYRPSSQYLDHIAPTLRQNRAAMRFVAEHNANAAEWLSPVEAPLQDWQQHALNSFYDAEIFQQDIELGRLFSFLEQSGALDETLVIIAADHGEGHGDHGFKGHSFVVYQELVHVPLLIRYPQQFPAGKRITTNVSTRRLFHTVLDVANIKPPLADDDPNANISGLSLRQSLNGKPDTEGGRVFSEAYPPINLLNILQGYKPALVEQLQLQQIRRGIYDGDHKLALVGDRIEQLYDVAADPAEAHNIAAEKPDVAGSLHAHLTQFVANHRTQSDAQMDMSALSEDVIENLRALGYME